MANIIAINFINGFEKNADGSFSCFKNVQVGVPDTAKVFLRSDADHADDFTKSAESFQKELRKELLYRFYCKLTTQEASALKALDKAKEKGNKDDVKKAQIKYDCVHTAVESAKNSGFNKEGSKYTLFKVYGFLIIPLKSDTFDGAFKALQALQDGKYTDVLEFLNNYLNTKSVPFLKNVHVKLSKNKLANVAMYCRTETYKWGKAGIDARMPKESQKVAQLFMCTLFEAYGFGSIKNQAHAGKTVSIPIIDAKYTSDAQVELCD